ncbi:thiamine pyrophosphate protein domain protein TPP-binding protein [Desulfarculus baarsii DSM 2075]|uniref:Thiamine pyrophosphate protein domain protein TPP-binding protein n=1 Tax=Desulfarculus baarsii (strain ATCC 33931 / DSM 2075 / LMG 7858 / VKM B-1802 / 2st14) TaxID=644282 RepID=E1QL52_DESB2|nr:thiamine pyrophosphate-dependent enzyme [Desulfarculus baarsii]ADK85317.1 thiamine pyrophosphate protein domain protein TPP-binding protein [Desulfarculus baarsii DSM 2075]
MSEAALQQVFDRPQSLKDVATHFCPGCHHGVIHRLVAEQLDAFGLRGKTIGVASVGCSVFLYDYFDVDVVEAPHGRAAAVATGVKRARPENFVFTYQGDGDLAAIGTAEIVHAANRGENICVVFVNNAVFGMTGGQMAPTTLEGQVTTTSPYGRSAADAGLPIRMSEMLATLEGAAFVARVAVNNIKNLQQAKKALHRAFEYQVNRWGFSFVEFLSACPTNWKMTPQQANKRVGEEMADYFPLAVFKDRQAL